MDKLIVNNQININNIVQEGGLSATLILKQNRHNNSKRIQDSLLKLQNDNTASTNARTVTTSTIICIL